MQWKLWTNAKTAHLTVYFIMIAFKNAFYKIQCQFFLPNFKNILIFEKNPTMFWKMH